MNISCDFCETSREFLDTITALKAGWWTHSVSDRYLTFEWPPSEPVPVSMGFVCPPCGQALPHEGDD